MTSAQFLTSGGHRCLTPGRVLALAAAAAAGASCTLLPHRPPLQEPVTLVSPATRARLWAVAPFANESGVSTVDTARIADDFRDELEQVHGIDTIAVNRVLAAMRATGLHAIGSAAEARQLAAALDVDALVVGTVTTWDPYPPPTLGMAVQVFDRAAAAPRPELDPRELVRSPGDTHAALGEIGPAPPIAQATGVFDSRNHHVLGWLQQYAVGRTEPYEAFGPDVYLMNMDLYTKFVSYRLIHDLLSFERSRISPTSQAPR